MNLSVKCCSGIELTGVLYCNCNLPYIDMADYNMSLCSKAITKYYLH